MIDKERLVELAAGQGITLRQEQADQFDRYAQLLVEWNARMNLTAITDPDGILIKHFLDSLLLLKYCPVPQGARLVDVGTGAGFPGMALKIARPDLSVCLMDSLNKRITFLKAVTEDLSLSAECEHLRAEDAGRQPRFRERFDLVTARAVASLSHLAEYCLPLCKVGGIFAPLKGAAIDGELEQAVPAIKKVGGRLRRCERYELSAEGGRSILIIEKISHSPTQYPRSQAKILKSPLI